MEMLILALFYQGAYPLGSKVDFLDIGVYAVVTPPVYTVLIFFHGLPSIYTS